MSIIVKINGLNKAQKIKNIKINTIHGIVSISMTSLIDMISLLQFLKSVHCSSLSPKLFLKKYLYKSNTNNAKVIKTMRKHEQVIFTIKGLGVIYEGSDPNSC